MISSPLSGHRGFPARRGSFQGGDVAPSATARAWCPGDARQRDVLPLPSGSLLRQEFSLELLQSEQGRWFQSGVITLNELACPFSAAGVAKTFTAAQRASLHGFWSRYSDVNVSTLGISDVEAFNTLRGARTGYADPRLETSGDFCIYRKGNVSLPSRRAGQVSLAESLPADVRATLMDPNLLLRSRDEVAARIEELDGPVRAMDPALERNAKSYASLLGELIQAGIIEMSTEIEAEAGLIFVRRKDGLSRLI